MKKLVLSLLSALCVAFPNWSAAADLTISGRASVEYQPAVKASRQTAAEEAQKEAIRNGLDAMMSSQPGAIRQLYEERKPDIYTTLIALARDVQNTQKDNKATHSMEVKVSAVIDEDVMKDTLMNKAATKKTVNLSDTLVAVFFTARNVVSVEQHTAATKSMSSSSATGESAVAEGETDSAITTTESRTEVNISESSASRTVKSDVLQYALDGPAREEFGSSLNDRFTSKGFEDIVDGAFFEAASVLDDAFGKGDVVPAAVWRKVVAGLREEEPGVGYMIVGTLDFGTPRKDSMTGMWVVEATVTGKVYKLGAKTPRLVAALSPQTMMGRAADQLQAKKRALAGISPLAADEILAKLKAKNIIGE